MKSVSSFVDFPEKELLVLLKKGNQLAFKELYSRYSGKIYGNVLKMLKSVELAEDVLQIAFMKIWHNRLAIDTDKSFKSYLYQIAENAVYDTFRKASRDKALASKMFSQSEESYLHVEQLIYEKESKAILEEAVAQLSPKRQKIYRMCKLEGQTYNQVSEVLGISASTVNDHIVKASKTVKDYLIETQYHIPLAVLIIGL